MGAVDALFFFKRAISLAEVPADPDHGSAGDQLATPQDKKFQVADLAMRDLRPSAA